MDIVGAAAGRDLVIVYPWYLGVSFSAYYKGTAPWQTMPPLPDHRLHRYDLARAASEDLRSGDELISRAASVLAGGGTVWVAGFPLYEESAAYVAKPERATGIAAADLRWSNQLAALLKTARAQVVVAPDPKVAGHERVMLVAFRQ